MARVITIISKAHYHLVITLLAPDKKFPMDFFPKGVPAVQFHNRSPSVTKNIEIYQSDMTALSSRHQHLSFIQPNRVLSKSHDNFMLAAAYLQIQIVNSMYSRKKSLKKCYSSWLFDEKNFSILNSNSYLEMLWKEICFVGPTVCFSLHYFIVDCFSFHCSSHRIFQITNQKSFLKE